MVSLLAILSCVLYTLSLFSPDNGYWMTSFVKLVLFGGVPLLYFLVRKQELSRVMYFGEKGSLKLPAILGGLCAGAILVGYTLLSSFFDPNRILSGLNNQQITKGVYPFVFLHIVLVNSFLEEFFFRGFLFRNLWLRGKKVYAYVFSSVLFALYHIGIFGSWFSSGMVLFCLLGLAVAGLFFCEVDRRCENIYAGWLIHLGANVGINLIGAVLFYWN